MAYLASGRHRRPAGGPYARHDPGARPSCFPTCWDSSMSGEPSQQGCVGDADLAPEVHNRELARAEEPSKGLWANPQPPLCLSEGNQLRRRGELQGEFLLPRGRVGPRTWAFGRGSHARVSPRRSGLCDAGDRGVLPSRGAWADTGARDRPRDAHLLSISRRRCRPEPSPQNCILGCKAMDQKAQEPLQSNIHGTTTTPP
jgi:hypothetical protein